jgi:hypothetical protein
MANGIRHKLSLLPVKYSPIAIPLTIKKMILNIISPRVPMPWAQPAEFFGGSMQVKPIRHDYSVPRPTLA